MKQYRFPDNRLWKAGFCLFLTAMLFLSRDTMFSQALIGLERAQFLVLGMVCALGVVFLIVNRRSWKQIFTDRRLLVAGVSAAVLLLPMVVKQDWQLMYLSVLLCVFIAVFLTYFTDHREVARYFTVVMAVLGVYSVLATYLLRIPADSGALPIQLFQNAKEFEFYNFGLSVVSKSYVKNRNFGIFREPGVYQYFLLLAMYLNHYSAEWKRRSTPWILDLALAVTMLSTFATGGVVEMGLLAIVIFFEQKLYRDKRIRTLTILLFVLFFVALFLIFALKGPFYKELHEMLIDKFKPGKPSGTDRFMSIADNAKLFLHKPLFGEKMATVLFVRENNTSSSTIFFAAYGIFGGLLHALSWAALVWDRNRKLWANLALLVILFMSFNTQNIIADVFFWLLPMMALTERTVCFLENRKKQV